MKTIRVLHLELDEHLGGIESFLYNLYSEIDRKKVQFDFISRSDNPAMGSELKELGAKIYKVSSYRNPLRYMSDLEDIIKKGNYDVIHIHKNSAAVILPFLVTRKYKEIRVFVHSHNTKPSVGGLSFVLHNINKRFLWYSADEHFACSKVAGKWLYGKHKEFIILKNGIITQKFKYDKNIRKLKRKELGIPEDAFVVGNVGRFTEQKNQRRLIDIFYEFLKKEANSWLLLVGDGKLRNSVEEYTNKIHLKNVYFLGVRKDIPQLMMAMDCFVMPSLYEGLPIVGIEAQTTGLQMLVADTVSEETKIVDQFTWFSLEESNEQIAQKINMTVSYDRSLLADDVIYQGFDMKQTALELERYYLNAVYS